MTDKEFMDQLVQGKTFKRWIVNSDKKEAQLIKLNQHGCMVDENSMTTPYPDDINQFKVLPDPVKIHVALDQDYKAYAFTSEQELDDLIKDREESYNAQITATGKITLQPE